MRGSRRAASGLPGRMVRIRLRDRALGGDPDAERARGHRFVVSALREPDDSRQRQVFVVAPPAPPPQ